MTTKAKRVAFAILIPALIATAWAKEQMAADNEKVAEKTPETENKKIYTHQDAKMWALGCSAVLVERNHDRHNLLGTDLRTPKNIEKMRDFIAVRPGWGIKSRFDLFNRLRQIDNGGHRKKFEELGMHISSLSEEEYRELLEKTKGDNEKLQEIRIVKKYYEELGEKSIMAWDYGRDICLCRWGYMAGYVSEEEAWTRIMAVAQMLQNKFDSWEDLGRNYLIGRQFWSYEKTKEEGHLFEDAYQRLLDMKSSPWNKYPWDMDLTDTKEVGDANKVSKEQQINGK